MLESFWRLFLLEVEDGLVAIEDVRLLGEQRKRGKSTALDTPPCTLRRLKQSGSAADEYNELQRTVGGK
jgi:hypothetical protein